MNILKKDMHDEDFDVIEKMRKSLLNDPTVVEAKDFGAGSTFNRGKTKSIRQIARHELNEPDLNRLIFRMIRQRKCKNILELGTSLGINTLYMARASQDVTVYSFEGNPQIAQYAKQTFSKAGVNNIKLIEGEIGLILPSILSDLPRIDLVFMDANHTYEATLSYYNIILDKLGPDSVLVLDDLYWSPGMRNAWEEIKNDSRVMATFDLFKAGIVFFQKELDKMHYRFIS
jgi:predicted O-methyltransferase YrrM